jgi:hypothetical protein
VLLNRLEHGMAGKSMVVTGLRGVGKTVLLNAFEDISIERDWVAVSLELDDESSFPQALARSVRRALLELRPTKKAAERLRFALGSLATFSLKDPSGFELSYMPTAAYGSEALSADFVDLLLILGETAQARGRGVVFLFDEVQCVSASDFGSLVVGLHRINQRSLPVTCVAAGLPSLPALAGRAKSYVERMFDYPRIGQLSRANSHAALSDPARHLGVRWEPEALDLVYEQTSGYPYFIQEYGKYAWDIARDSCITTQDAREGGRVAQNRLDDGFFRVRVEGRATKAERAFLYAMAACQGPPYPIAKITSALGMTDQRSLSVRRTSLIRKGLIYAPEHGLVDYTVPGFAAFLRRQDPESQLQANVASTLT